ncbi:MAG TPA: hypothetical protein VGA96_15920 [Fibrella sp.]
MQQQLDVRGDRPDYRNHAEAMSTIAQIRMGPLPFEVAYLRCGRIRSKLAVYGQF